MTDLGSPQTFAGGVSREEATIRLLMQLRRHGITDTGVLSAIERVPRHLFVAATLQPEAYSDRALPIECGQTISQPFVVALMSQLLTVSKRDIVLEVGTGSGYQAAVLSHLARRVYSIERHRTLLRQAEDRFNQLGIYNITTRLGDGFKGWPEQAPFDRIIVTAASEDVPETLLNQLKVGGIMVVPVGPSSGVQRLMRIVRTETGHDATEEGEVRFVPLLPGVDPDG